MGENSHIEWCDHTFNPWEGCQKVGPGCDNRYAEALMDTLYQRVKWGPGQARSLTSEANWKKPLAWNRAAQKAGVRPRAFCASLADVFDNAVRPEWRAGLWDLINQTPHLDWLLLTKRPGNLAAMLPVDWGDGYGNVWLGCTVVNQAEADRGIPKLLAVPATVRFLSMEPLLGAVDVRPWLGRYPIHMAPGGNEGNPSDGWIEYGEGINWIIVGGESGGNARPMRPDWARSLRDQCQAAGVAFFFKQWGEWLPMGQSGFTAWSAENVRNNGIGKSWRGIAHFNDGAGGPETHRIGPCATTTLNNGDQASRVGKSRAGRLLDGREHNDMPGVR